MKIKEDFCTLMPYFTVINGHMEEALSIADKLCEISIKEEGCLFYNYTVHKNIIHFREAFVDATAVFLHIENIKETVANLAKISTRSRAEIHGTRRELGLIEDPRKNTLLTEKERSKQLDLRDIGGLVDPDVDYYYSNVNSTL
jgi:quinol monooxygenase YgiN